MDFMKQMSIIFAALIALIMSCGPSKKSSHTNTNPMPTMTDSTRNMTDSTQHRTDSTQHRTDSTQHR